MVFALYGRRVATFSVGYVWPAVRGRNRIAGRNLQPLLSFLYITVRVVIHHVQASCTVTPLKIIPKRAAARA